MKILQEFKNFAMRGNVVDMAVGVVIGGAFGKTVPQVAIAYGAFVTAAVNFLIIAVAIFMVVKAMSYLRRKEEALPPPPAPAKEQLLLTEIRDILKARA